MARPCPVEIPTPENFSTPNLTPTPESTPKSVIGSPKSDTSTSNSGTSSSKSFRTPLSPKFAEKESEAEPRTPVRRHLPVREGSRVHVHVIKAYFGSLC